MHLPDNTNEHADNYRCMVENVWHEARGEGLRGMHAVALVTMNRVKQRKMSVCSVVYKPHQFSWTSDVTGDMQDNIVNVRRAVANVMTGGVADFTKGATHYHTKYVKPYWAKDMKKTVVVGKHIFYRKQK
jgi:N-acetylmuramoyl-L-alanine amidase